MKLRHLLAAVLFTGISTIAVADLDPWTDYDISEGVTNVTTVKVDSNRIDTYLEGLSLGQMVSYRIFVSELPASGDFNVILVTNFANASDLQPAKENYDAFMEAWGDANQAINDEIVPTYPGIRTITGEYLVREITLK